MPYGVVLTDRDGTLKKWNARAAELLGHNVVAHGARCEELFACSRETGPCEHECMVSRVVSSHETTDERRVETRHGAGVSAVWVTAAPVRGGEAMLLHLRPGDSRDRRRRSVPVWTGQATVRLRALGNTTVEGPGGPLAGRWLSQRSGQLLKYLVCQRGRPAHAEEIAEALWPGSPQGPNNTKYCVHALRQRLEPDRGKGRSSFVISEPAGYALSPAAVKVDVERFESLVRRGVESYGRGDTGAAERQLARGVSLYAGDLVSDEPYAEWARAPRDEVRGILVRALRLLAVAASARGDTAGAAAHLERLAKIDRYDPGIHRELLTAWIAEGRLTDAHRHYAAFRDRLRRVFQTEPGFVLQDLRPDLGVESP